MGSPFIQDPYHFWRDVCCRTARSGFFIGLDRSVQGHKAIGMSLAYRMFIQCGLKAVCSEGPGGDSFAPNISQ